MAIKALDETSRPRAPRAIRSGDSLRAPGVPRRGGADLRMIRLNRDERRGLAVSPPARGVGAPGPASAPVSCVRVRPEGEAAAGAVEGSYPRSPMVEAATAPATGSMFDVHVDEARTLATAVRGSVRTAEEPAGTVVTARVESNRMRLTLRGQRVAVALGFALSIGLGALVGAAIGTEPLPEQTATVVVKPGDSLWSIAEAVSQPGRDLRPVMEQIAALNDLDSPIISSGQSLIVPAN